MPLLEVEDLHAGYGRVPVLHGVALTLPEGETAAVVGRFGTGKSTLLGCVAGVVRPRTGRILFDGAPVHKLEPAALVPRGIVLVPQGRHLFHRLSVEENLVAGAWIRRRERGMVEELRGFVLDLFPMLKEALRRRAGSLSRPDQGRLAIARGLMAVPRLLLVDEPSIGLAAADAAEVFAALRRIGSEGITVLVAEENPAVLHVVDRAFMMEDGRISFEGTGSEVVERANFTVTALGLPA